MSSSAEKLRGAACRCARVNADVALLCESALRAADEIERLGLAEAKYHALLRANGPAWLQQVSGGSYMDAVAACKRAGWWPESSNGWPDTDAERSAGG